MSSAGKSFNASSKCMCAPPPRRRSSRCSRKAWSLLSALISNPFLLAPKAAVSVLDDAYVQLVELVRINRAGRVNHQVCRRGGLGEGHQVAYVLDAGERHQHALYSSGNASVRRRAVLQRVEEETEALARLLFRQSQGFEDEPLHVAPVDADRAARDLDAVDHSVVSLRAKPAEQPGLSALDRALKQRQVFVERRGERVVHRVEAPFRLVELEHRELRYPQRREDVRRNQLLSPRDLVAQSAQRSRHDRGPARDDEQRVALLRPGARGNARDRLLAERLQKRRRKLIAELHPGERPRAVALRELLKFVQRLTREVRAAAHDETLDLPALLNRRGERRERRPFERGREVLQLHPEAQVWLVAAVAPERLGVGETLKRRLQLRADESEDAGEQALDQSVNLLARGEAELNVELREFGLAVGPQVFVAEAARDLVILVEARDHANLLENLRRLRQRVEPSGVESRRHDVVARAFRR